MAGGFPSSAESPSCPHPRPPPQWLPTCLFPAGRRSSAAGPAWQGGCSLNQPAHRFPWKERLQVATRNFPGFSLSLISLRKMEAFLLSRGIGSRALSSRWGGGGGGGRGGCSARTVCRAPLAEARGSFHAQIGLPGHTRSGKLLGSSGACCSVPGGEGRWGRGSTFSGQ